MELCVFHLCPSRDPGITEGVMTHQPLWEPFPESLRGESFQGSRQSARIFRGSCPDLEYLEEEVVPPGISARHGEKNMFDQQITAEGFHAVCELFRYKDPQSCHVVCRATPVREGTQMQGYFDLILLVSACA